MKATIDFDDALYRRLKIEAARRGRTIRELVTEGVRHVLDTPAGAMPDAEPLGQWQPDWLGSLERYARPIRDHSMTAVRESIIRGRGGSRP